MELSERWIQKFEDEGFLSVFEEAGPAGKVYQERINKGKVSVFVTDGGITFDFSGEIIEVVANKRFDIPVGKPYSAVVGTQGWIAVIAEETKGDF